MLIIVEAIMNMSTAQKTGFYVNYILPDKLWKT